MRSSLHGLGWQVLLRAFISHGTPIGRGLSQFSFYLEVVDESRFLPLHSLFFCCCRGSLGAGCFDRS